MPRISPGMVLVASPQLEDPNFMRSVVYLLEHNDSGTLGLIVNRPLDITLGELWEQCPPTWKTSRRCAEGGPVDRHKGLLLHDQMDLEGAMALPTGLAVGGDPAQLDIDRHPGPRLFLGHSGWSQNQLLEEMAAGSWLLRQANPELLLNPEPPDDLWLELIRTNEEYPDPSVN